MDKFLYQAFQNLSTEEVPNELHASIFRAAAFRRSWKYASFLTGVTALAFIFSLWHVYTRSMEIETFSAIKAIVGTIDLNVDSLADSARTLVDFLPVQAIVITLLNLTALVFMVFLMRSFSRLQAQFRM